MRVRIASQLSRVWGAMDRRRFVALVGSALAAPFAGAEPPARHWRVGFLAQIARPAPIENHFFGALPQGLRELGYVDGKNLAMEWTFGDGRISALPKLAAQLVARNPDIVVTAGTLSAVAMRDATSTLPVVFGNVSDPVASGLVKSLARPGTNMTGLASLAVDLIPKLFEHLMVGLPGMSRIAALINPAQASQVKSIPTLQAAAERSGVRVKVVEARTPQEIEQAFAQLARDRTQGLIIALEGLFIQQRRQLVELSEKHRIATVSGDNEFARAGGVISYGADQVAMFRRAAGYVDRILKGAMPADLPVEQPITFELVVNRKAARGLGLNISPSLLLRADRVIE